MKAYEVQKFGIEDLALVERDQPQVKPTEALVKFHAASLNYRDLMVVTRFLMVLARSSRSAIQSRSGKSVTG
jgi:NADPH:quinone reductase-like Zn-dependent oxidoreductase